MRLYLLRGFNLGFAVSESNAKLELNNSRGKHKINYGFQTKLYQLDPGFIEKASDSSLVETREVQQEKGVESALFLADQMEINDRLSLYVGLRYSFFSALGPRTVYNYFPGLSKSTTSISDTVNYSSGEVMKNFHGPEYRVSLRYKVSQESAIKASYNRTRQYIHMLSNTVSVSPTDTWKLSDQHVLPQIGDQVSIGFYRDLKDDAFELSTEVYYKWLQNVLDYKTGATLLVNENIDQQIIQGNGKAYGVEVLLRKKSGTLTGWLGYSYSRTFIQLRSPIISEQINRGDIFPRTMTNLMT
jgi:outer membrane receptor protein involved in Fe transport